MIELEHAHRHFSVGGQVVRGLDDVSLRIAQGDYLAVVGPSGSGKSTLLNALGLLDRLSGGTYRLDGHDVTGLCEEQLAQIRRERIGFVFQFFHLIARLSAAQNVEMPLLLSGVAPAERRARVCEALAAYGISDRAAHRPDQLSGGQRQRVAIARAAIMRPRMLLADEPTGNLDRASGEAVVEILERLNLDGITMLLVTHDPELAARAGRRLTMVDGRVESDSGAAA